MFSENLQIVLKPVLLTLRIVHFAFSASIIGYGAVLFMFINKGLKESSSMGSTMESYLYGVAVVIAIAALVYRQHLYSQKHLAKLYLKDISPEQLATNSQTKILNEARLSQIKSLPQSEYRFLVLVHSMIPPNIINLAINEAVALQGFALGFMLQEPNAIIPFALVSLALNASIWPRPETLYDRVQRFGLTYFPTDAQTTGQ